MKFINLYNILLQNRLDDYKLQLKDDQLAQSIFSLNDPKKQKMIIKWIKNGSIKYPKDMQIIDKVYQIISRKGLDYNNYNSPQQILNQFNQLNQKIDYNPDNEPCFTNKVELGKGVVVYNVQDDEQGQKAVRKAVDYNWGKDAKPWCLIVPPLDRAYQQYWNYYNKIPKRICFQNKKLVAFCASNKYKIQWWNREDISTSKIPIEGVKDDPKAIQNMLNNMPEKDRYIYLSETSTNPEQLKQIYQKYKDETEYPLIHRLLAQNPNTPLETLQKLSNDKDQNILVKVVKNSNCPIEILKKLANNEHSSVKEEIAKNPNSTSEILLILLKLLNNNISHYYIKRALINNPNSSFQIFQKLSQDEDVDIRKHVAKNPNTPISILNKLAKEKEYMVSYIVRSGVASNPNCPIQLLTKLANDESRTVKMAVFDNPNTPREIRKKIRIE